MEATLVARLVKPASVFRTTMYELGMTFVAVVARVFRGTAKAKGSNKVRAARESILLAMKMELKDKIYEMADGRWDEMVN